MQATAFDRARKLMGTQSGAVTRAKILGVLESLFCLALFLVVALLLVLLTTRGEVFVSKDVFSTLPPWVESRVTAATPDGRWIEDSGLAPFVVRNRASGNLAHQWAARAVQSTMSVVPTLQNNLGCLATLLALGLALFATALGFRQARQRAMATAVSEAASSMRRQLHRQMYRLGQSALPTEGTGPVINIFSREVNDVRDGLHAQLDIYWTVPILVVGLLLIALLTSWLPTLFLASLGGLVWIAARALEKTNGARSSLASRDLALQYYLLQEDLGLLRTVRVHGMENVDKERFDEHASRHRDADRSRMIVEGESVNRLVLLLGIAGTLGIGILIHSVVVRGASPASAFILLAALRWIFPPVAHWIKESKAIRQATRSAAGVFQYLERAPELQQAVGAQFVPPIKEKVTFENVSLDNARGRPILDGFSAEIKAGTRVAIMSLDEESTHAIACLIPRLIDPKSGRVRFDGLDLRDVTLESLRAQVASVLQADLVFSDSIFANIGLGDSSYDLPRVIEAAKVAHAHQFIQDLPHGYETQVGPMGHYLSPDQQYRIGLARAILHDPSIVILEEPTTHFDDDTKHLIDDTTARLAVGRTLIILPHRLSTVRNSDQVFIIQNGRLEAVGTPRDLHQSNKLFRHIEYTEFNRFANGELEVGQMNG